MRERISTLLTIVIILITGFAAASCGDSEPEPTVTPPATATSIPTQPPAATAAPNPTLPPPDEESDVWTLIQSNDDLTRLKGLIEEAELIEKLQSDGPFTLFAPTDEVFAALDDNALDDPNTAFDVLLYHLVAEDLSEDDLSSLSTLTTLLGDELGVVENEGELMIGKATIVEADIETVNGRVHIIDTVLFPPSLALLFDLPITQTDLPDLVKTAQTANSFETLLAGLHAADLIEALQEDGPFTVLAPTDEAFLALVDNASERLLHQLDTNPSPYLLYHVIPGALNTKAIHDGLEVVTLHGAAIRFVVEKDDSNRADPQGQIAVQGGDSTQAQILLADIAAGNGFIHVLDAVILPPNSP
ncbi:fasciclin domain-containing protein [Chloroflexi bacterium TSY]|nr:fasciclin domain-containing protein [Chloroflexi bacterium TSY]